MTPNRIRRHRTAVVIAVTLIKPILANAEFFSLGEEENLLRNIWEGIVAVTAVLLQNQPEDQFASVIPFSGELADVDADLLSAMLSILLLEENLDVSCARTSCRIDLTNLSPYILGMSTAPFR